MARRELRAVGGCIHHWRLETPYGPTVAGECQLCGMKRKFPSADRSGYLDEQTAKRRSRPFGDYQVP